MCRNIRIFNFGPPVTAFTIHSNGGPVIWNFESHGDTAHALGDVARDRDNKVVMLTGAGDTFIAEHEFGDADKIPAAMWDHVITDAKYLIMNHLVIEAPMITAGERPFERCGCLGQPRDAGCPFVLTRPPSGQGRPCVGAIWFVPQQPDLRLLTRASNAEHPLVTI